MTATSLSTLLRELAQDLFEEDFLDFTPLVNGDASSTQVPASELRHTSASPERYNNGWLYVYEGVGAGDERAVLTYSGTQAISYGMVTLVRPLSVSSLDATSRCLLYNGAHRPSTLKRHLNKALRRMRRQRMLPITYVVDGLMEEAGTASWTASSASLAKTTAAGNIYEGGQALTVTNSGVNGAAQSTSIPVIPNERLRIEAVVRVGNTSGTNHAELLARDVTNGAVLDSMTTENRERTRLTLEVVVPTGCYELQVWLSGQEASTVTHWDEVLLWRPEERQIRLSADVDRFDEPFDAFQRIPVLDSPSGAQNAEAPYRVDFTRLSGWDLLPNPTAATPYVLDLSRSNWSGEFPLLVDGLFPWPELGADTETTNATKDDLLLRARAIAYAQLAKDGPRDDRSFYKEQADLLAKTWATQAARQPRPARPINSRPSRRVRSDTWWDRRR